MVSSPLSIHAVNNYLKYPLHFATGQKLSRYPFLLRFIKILVKQFPLAASSGGHKKTTVTV
jgi:hypothetical protein